MKESARLIIPLWGEVYAQKLVSMTLPALLSPGNLPALASEFDLEVVLVTETRLFDRIRQAPSHRALSSLCRTRFASLDDLLSDLPGDYGVVLTCALFRGFTDLGAQMTQTYLLFLNADFIVCDGGMRHLAKLMREGKRVIHAPSFRVVLEDVWPQLLASVDPSTSILRLSPREMVKLALTHKHLTVKARTVNQRLCHQAWMDQFYWFVDEDTLIGYQWPIALVAIKPQRVVTEPVQVWDYGFIPEASPTAERYFIDDSDDFFMLEPQKRATGEELMRIGWLSNDQIARDLSKYTTKEQRECGRQVLKIHASDLSPDADRIIEESRAFMADVERRIDPVPQPHIGHSHLSDWFAAARQRIRERHPPPPPPPGAPASADPSPAPALSGRLSKTAVALLRRVYQKTLGTPPRVGNAHPLWLDTNWITGEIDAWRESRARILWLTSRDSLFHTLLQNRVDPAALFLSDSLGILFDSSLYDACLCELMLDEAPNINRLYAKIRPLMRDGGKVAFLVGMREELASTSDIVLYQTAFPDIDVSEIRFYGSAATKVLRRWYLNTSTSFFDRPLWRAIATGAVLIGLAPFARIANALASRRDPSVFAPRWTTAIIQFTVKKGVAVGAACPQGANRNIDEKTRAAATASVS